jgi:hypothetical protein
MGSNLEGFNIRLEFDNDAKVAEVIYWDQEGCGHEAIFAPVGSLGEMVQYHLNHYRASHDMRPRKGCKFTVSGLPCVEEFNHKGDHVIRVEQ